MARHAIVEKLHKELQRPINSEAQVVYMLVELRKMLEYDGKKEAYPVLNFYCNWVVHPKLEQSAIAEKIIRLNDAMYQYIVSETEDASMVKELRDLLDHTALQRELTAYLTHLNLPNRISTVQRRWLRFLRKLGSVIEDCPLMIQANSKKQKPPTRFVKSISVSNKSLPENEDLHLEWNTVFHTNPKGWIRELPS